MDIWQILQVEPTTDKKAIKKAYATRSKEVHPEEKPEEFSRLYDAYQSALHHAKMTEQAKKKGNQGENRSLSQSRRKRIPRNYGKIESLIRLRLKTNLKMSPGLGRMRTIYRSFIHSFAENRKAGRSTCGNLKSTGTNI